MIFAELFAIYIKIVLKEPKPLLPERTNYYAILVMNHLSKNFTFSFIIYLVILLLISSKRVNQSF